MSKTTIIMAGAMACAAAYLSLSPVRAQSKAPAAASLRLYVLDGGTLKARDAAPYGLSPEQVPPRDLSDPCMLIVHPRGTLMWETGLNESVNATPANAPAVAGGPRPGDHVDKPLLKQLADLGYTPRDVTYLALSHSHWDHTGNASAFAGSTWLVQKLERDLIFGERPLSNQKDFDGLRASKAKIIDGDHDVFGDGSVTLIFTPGHTAGHQSLLVKLPKTGAVLLSGDLYHFSEEVTLKPALRGRNAEQTSASMAKVQDLVARTHAQLWIQHDAPTYATLKKAPAFYE
jgi:glyoxylase-like metal-dependent hydrolase (beta-lactamase superfamily II)